MYKHCVCKVVVLLYKPILFSRSCCLCRHRKLPVVVIQKFCYHGYVTSHFPLYTQLEDVQMWPRGRNLDSGIREIFVCRIRNLRKFFLWNQESWVFGIRIQTKESGIPLTIWIHNPSSSVKDWNPVTEIRNPRRGIQFHYIGERWNWTV